MKLHLPLPLFRRLTLLMAAVSACVTTADAAVMMTEQATRITYADFGQNAGRYVTGGKVSSLLDYIRTQEGGVTITYIDGTPTKTLEHGMIDFSSVIQEGATGAGNLIAPNAVITAGHNREFNPSFTDFLIGADNAVRYQGIEYRDSKYLEICSNNTGNQKPQDVKMTRLNKLVTDVLPANYYSGDTSAAALSGQTIYHSGAGRQYDYLSETDSYWWEGNPYTYITGGITVADGGHVGEIVNPSLVIVDTGNPALSDAAPLPYQPQDGDSGSPIFTWDAAANQYAYVGSYSAVNALVALGGHTTYSKALFDPTLPGQLDAFTDAVTPAAGTHRLDIMPIANSNEKGSSVSETINGTTYTATDYYSKVIDMDASRFGSETSFRFNHLDTSKNVYTWQALNAEMNKDNWYHYGTEYMNLADQSAATSADKRTWAELYASRNNLFVAKDADNYTIRFSGIYDMGLGYLQFSKEEGTDSASFTLAPYLSSLASFSYPDAQVLTSGYIVDKDVTLHLQFTNAEDYVREWRKVGEGTLSVEGEGDNWALLNVGGAGKTELNREGGFAAYNVLANTGSTVVLKDINQIARDFTFGNGGAVLDFNGASMTWNNTAAVEDEGFTIHALTEEALITNNKADTLTTLTVTDAGDTYLGSFSDEGAGSLKVVYKGGEGSNWELHSLHTELRTHEDSGLEVQSGTVSLSGTLTQHGLGTLNPGTRESYSHEDDWHYADASMNVEVKDGGTFELGSHARLTGDVTVEQGGTYIMHEGVRHAQEYVEGGQVLESTDKYAAFYGHKGDVKLAGGTMAVQISAGTDKDFAYDGAISGEGKVSVDAGNARVLLGGYNTMSGANEVTHGTLIATGEHSLGNGTWDIQSGAVLAAKEFEGKNSATILASVHGDSQGVLALTADHAEAFDMSAHRELALGALEGTTVHYGSADTALSAQNAQWKLGGAGGTLVVESKLDAAATLVLGDAGSTGTVVLNNAANSLSGVSVEAQADMELRGTFSLRDGGAIATGDGASLTLTDSTIHALGAASVSGNVSLGNVTTYDDFTIGGTVNLNGKLNAASGIITFRDAVLNVDNSCVEELGSVYGSGNEVGGYAANANGFRGEAVRVGDNIGISGNYVLEGTSTYSYGGLVPTISSTTGGTTTAIQLANDKIYHANTGVVTVGGSGATELTAEADGFHVNEGGTLKVTDKASNTLGVVAIVSGTTGDGTMQLATSATLANKTAVAFGGTLEVLGGATLALGTSGDYAAVNTSSLNTLALNGGNLSYGATGGSTLQNLAVNEAATLNISSTGNSAFDVNRINVGTLALNEALEVKTTYYSSLKVDKLTGKGDLILRGASNSQWASASKVAIDSLEDFTGALVLERLVNVATGNKGTVLTHADINAGAEAVEMKGVTLASGATATITAENTVHLGAVDVSANQLSGAASALTVKGAGFSADTLQLGAGSVQMAEDATLTVADSLHAEAATEGGTATLTGGSVQGQNINDVTATDAALELNGQNAYDLTGMKMLGASTLYVSQALVSATNCELQNLTLGYQAALSGESVKLSGASYVDVTAAPAMLMTMAEGGEETPVVLYSQQLEGVTMAEGATLVLNWEGLLPQFNPNHTLYTIVFTGLTWETQGDILPYITYQNAWWAEEREMTLLSATYDSVGTAVTLSIQAPEPATATLSLLALGALAARRRRR